MDKIKDNLAFLSKETNAHMHIDLIIGLPTETIESFASNSQFEVCGNIS